MPKLVKKSDGSISFELDASISEESKKKDFLNNIKETKSMAKDKGFNALTAKDKDNLLEILLKMHDLI